MRASFWNLVKRSKDDECWPWLGSRIVKNGKLTYGQLTVAGRRYLAHRFSFRIKHGVLPAKFFICHTCNNPPCVNPAHLYVADNSRNITDAWRDGLIISGNSKKKNCPKCGSEYSHYKTQNRRFCRKCKTLWQKNNRTSIK